MLCLVNGLLERKEQATPGDARTVTVAFGRTAPFASVTVPCTVAVDCASTGALTSRPATSINSGKKRAIFLLSMKYLQVGLTLGERAETAEAM